MEKAQVANPIIIGSEELVTTSRNWLAAEDSICES